MHKFYLSFKELYCNIKERRNACFFLGCNQPIKYCPFGQLINTTIMSKRFSFYLPVKWLNFFHIPEK